MTIEHEVRLSKTIKRLDVADDVPEGVSAFPGFLSVDGLTVAELAQARAMEIPAATITKTDGSQGWLVMRYVKKTKKGAASKSAPLFYSKAEGLVSVPWLAESTTILTEEFILSGWAFPLRAFSERAIL